MNSPLTIKKSAKFLIIILIFIQSGCTYFVATEELKISALLENFHDSESGEVFVAAHRAMHTKYPENSLAAIKDAIDNDIDIIEIDVRRTKDNKLILMHDNKIDRTTNGIGKVSDLHFNEIEKYELVRTDSSKLSRRIPTLEEALLLAKNKILIDIDIKGAPVKILAETVIRTQTKKQIIFFDSEFEVLDSLLLLDSTFIIMPRARSSKDVEMIISKYSPEVIHIDDSFFTAEVVNKITENNSRVWINALGTPDSIARTGKSEDAYTPLVMGGANIIQTDLPVKLKQYLDSIKKR